MSLLVHIQYIEYNNLDAVVNDVVFFFGGIHITTDC